MLEILKKQDISEFIHKNENADVAELALKKPPDASWPWPLILGQIKARRKAKDKLPAWHKTDGVIFPPPSLLEQASSEATARFKAALSKGKIFADLTCGAGVDFRAFLENFGQGLGVERDENACALLRHNLKILGAKNFEIINASAENALQTLPSCDLIYIDPQRRDGAKKGKFRLEDCAPDILNLLPSLRSKAKTILLKTSPVLDIDAGTKALKTVSDVYVVEWRGDCREVLYVLKDGAQEPRIHAVTINDDGAPVHKLTFTRAEEETAETAFAPPEKYLYEPSPAFQKAGAFKTIAARYGVKKIAPSTHLYTSEKPVTGFPGRSFEIHGVYPVDAKVLPVKKANLTLRNFPGSAEALRKKLGLLDGGPETLFACTLAEGRKILAYGRKYGS